MSRPEFSISSTFRDFIEFLRASQLEVVTVEYLRRLREHNPPFLRFFAGMPENELIALNVTRLDDFLSTLLDGTAPAVAAEGLRAWEADELPGIPKESFDPSEVMLVSDAYEGAILSALDVYTDDRAVALTIVREVRRYYMRAELNAYEVYTRIRDGAVQKATRAAAEHEADKLRLAETQELNEELVSQQEELNLLYAQLQEHSRVVESEVARRTEDLQAANEELGAHHEELVAVNEQLHQQALALAEQKAFMENMVSHLPTGIAYMDRDMVFRWVNPEFASFANLPADAFHGRTYYDVFPFMENPNPRLVSVVESGQTARTMGLPVIMPGGETTYWDVVYVPVFDAAGRADGLMLMAQNATTRIQAEQVQQRQIDQLQEVDRLKNDFLSILSHELRTPINAIMGFASILDDEVTGPLNADQHTFTRRILSGSDVLLALIEDLLDMSRMQAGKFSLSPAPLAPRDVIDDALASLTHLAEQKGQTITLAIAAELAPIEADPQRLRQVLTNLIGNAIKFGADNDAIVVRARTGPDGLHCEVEDHGEGISPEDIPKLFQRFTQLDTGNTRKAGGAGLGLSIVKALVEAHGGAVGVQSEPRRTVFWFSLPAHSAVSVETADVR